MEASAFGLSRDPFERSPDLDDACLPNTLASLLSELQSSLRSPQGLSVLVAPSGSGKSMAAAAFARRLASVAHVAVIARPASSMSAIAREALAKLGDEDPDFTLDDDWGRALREHVERRAALGRATALVIDDAHRLSPQALESLADLFGDDEASRLHVFLFGRPRLLDRIHAGAEKALHQHLLQICRLEPLGVRESVRYLERRLAFCGGSLGDFVSDEAIDEIVLKSEGRLLRLEDVASRAMERAARRGAARVEVDDARAIAPRTVVEEDEVMAAQQQPFRFEIPEEDGEDDGAWEAGDEVDEDEEWEAEAEGEEEEWEADGGEADEGLEWGSVDPRLDEAEEDEIEPPARRPATAPRAVPVERRMAGRAILSLGACLALVWAANHLPGPAAETPHGRDSLMFPEPLSNKPEQILRLARTAEAADADAHVVLWRSQPPPPSVASSHARPDEAVADARDAGRPSREPEPAVARVPVTGPMLPEAPMARPMPGAAGGGTGPGTGPKSASTSSGPVESKASKPMAKSSVKASAAAKEPVYTVQLGAFKTRSNAEQLATKVKGRQTRILREDGLYRVMSGSFDSRRDAALHEASLKKAGYTTFVRTVVF